MSIESNAGKMCPYWRKFVSLNGHVLALCGAESPDQFPLEDEVPRLEECPFFGREEAYTSPSILEVKFDSQRRLVPSNEVVSKPWHEIDLDLMPTIIRLAKAQGLEGIRHLETFWDQETKRFIRQHSNP